MSRAGAIRAGRRGGGKLRQGFTLLEVLLTLGLISVLTGVLVTLSIHLTEPKAVTVEDVFWNAVAESRKQALLSGGEVRLRFVSKNKEHAFVLSGGAGQQPFPIEETEAVAVDFLSTQKARSAILIRSQLVETQTLPFVTFYGDGTCTPFRVQIRTGGPARTLSIDPWTCAPVLEPATVAAAGP